MEITAELRQTLMNNSERFTPSWAFLKSAKFDGTSQYSPLEVCWKAGAPIIYKDDTFNGENERWSGVYMGWVKTVLTASQSGEPTSVQDSANLVKLCEAFGYILMSNRRIIAKLDGGIGLGSQYSAGLTLIISLPLVNVVSVEMEVKKKVFGGDKPGPTTVKFAGSSIGAMNISPERGLNSPWNEEDRRIWGRGVELSMFRDIVEPISGSVPSAGTTSFRASDEKAGIDGFIQERITPFL